MVTLKGSSYEPHNLPCSNFRSLCNCQRTYCLIWSSSRPIVLTQYPFAQKWRPQYRLFNSWWMSNILIALLPFMKPMASEIEYLGGTDNTRWMWSIWILPSKISIFLHSHSCRMISRSDFPNSPLRIWKRYFGHHTTWYLHEYTVFEFDLYATSYFFMP